MKGHSLEAMAIFYFLFLAHKEATLFQRQERVTNISDPKRKPRHRPDREPEQSTN
jgi:hypothetical protein